MPAVKTVQGKFSRKGDSSTALAVLSTKDPIVIPGFANGDLVSAFVNELADKFDPPEWRTVAQEETKPFKPPDIVSWAHNNFIDPITGKLIHLQKDQIRILRVVMQLIWLHKVTTVVYSDIKKSGKTTLAGLIGAYWAENIEAPNEVISIANDKEQAAGRIYNALIPTMRRLGWDVPKVNPLMTNRTTNSVIKAIGTNYAGEAGGNYGLTLWSELWAYKSEDRKRLWEEMTQVPTRKYSIRWVETYAGFKGQSELLWKLYCTAFKDGDETKPLGKKIKGLSDLPLWFIPESETIVYWNHIPRMPWQTPRYYKAQRKELRPNAYKRLHQNEWVSGEDVFILPEQWDQLEKCKTLSIHGDVRPIVLAADAGIYSDSAALTAAAWDAGREGADLVSTWMWLPAKIEGFERPQIDLKETIGKQIEDILSSGNFSVLAVYYDPWQLHSIMVELKKKFDRNDSKKLFVEFPQTNARILSDQYFYQSVVSKNIKHDGNPILREHVLNAVVDETTRGFRLDKALNVNKIDAAVTASMAAYAASVRNHAKRGFLKA